jgi:3-deoxy-D-manno-octulosonate 8-phosphate phosphatase (KDO 8-P phosphatase)
MDDRYPADIIERAGKIKILILDIDGVLTDGKLIYTDRGEEIKNFNVNDGLGIFLLRNSGIRSMVVTAKGSGIVNKRCKELRIDKVYKNCHYKIKAFEDIIKRFKVSPENICFVGDDLIDIPVLRRVGLAVCPENAVREVKEHVHFVTEQNGGNGAVREVCDFILKSQNKWEEITKPYFE